MSPKKLQAQIIIASLWKILKFRHSDEKSLQEICINTMRLVGNLSPAVCVELFDTLLDWYIEEPSSELMRMYCFNVILVVVLKFFYCPWNDFLSSFSDFIFHQWLATSRCFFPCTPVFCTNKTDRFHKTWSNIVCTCIFYWREKYNNMWRHFMCFEVVFQNHVIERKNILTSPFSFL
jgi:hypothetical protein